MTRDNNPPAAVVDPVLQQAQDSTDTDETSTKGAKRKQEPATLAEFIKQAYRKQVGSATTLAAISKKGGAAIKLDPADLDEIRELAKADLTLDVARKLLLAVNEDSALVARGPTLELIRELLAEHPLARAVKITALLANADEQPPMPRALATIMSASKKDVGEPLSGQKDSQLAKIKYGLASTLMLWLKFVRGVSLDEFIEQMSKSVWAEAGKSLDTDSKRWQALLALSEPEPVGLITAALAEKLSDQNSRVAQAQERIRGLEAQLNIARTEACESKERELKLQQQCDEISAYAQHEINKLQQENQTLEVHLRDDKNRLRARLCRRLREEVEFLESGLEALRHEQPKIHIMKDRAERVADALRHELKRLGEE